MTPRRAGTSAVVAVLGVVVLLVLVTWAASTGPDHVLRRPGPPAGSAFLTHDGSTAQLGPESHNVPPSEPAHPPTWLRLSATLVELLASVVFLYLLGRLLAYVRERWVNRERRPTRQQPDVEFDVLGDPVGLAAALEADAGEQRRRLEEGEPRNAIVACWHRLELTAELAGARRRIWQTPSEFVLAVLEVAGADGDAVLRLAALYREARFSDHPLSEDHRRAALTALEQTQASLSRSAHVAGTAGGRP
jgi:hypothetical protein